MSISGRSGILDAYIGKEVDLIVDLGNPILAATVSEPIKVRGNLNVSKDSTSDNEYVLLISGWDAFLTFDVNQAMVKLDLGEHGVPEDITITVLPKEIF